MKLSTEFIIISDAVFTASPKLYWKRFVLNKIFMELLMENKGKAMWNYLFNLKFTLSKTGLKMLCHVALICTINSITDMICTSLLNYVPYAPLCLTCLTPLRALRALYTFVHCMPFCLTRLTHASHLRTLRTFFKCLTCLICVP